MENKAHGNPRACVRIHVYTHACSKPAYICFMHAYAYMGMHMHAKVPKTMKDKFFSIKVEVWDESLIVQEPFQTPIFSLYKAIHGTFSKHPQNPMGKCKIY